MWFSSLVAKSNLLTSAPFSYSRVETIWHAPKFPSIFALLWLQLLNLLYYYTIACWKSLMSPCSKLCVLGALGKSEPAFRLAVCQNQAATYSYAYLSLTGALKQHRNFQVSESSFSHLFNTSGTEKSSFFFFLFSLAAKQARHFFQPNLVVYRHDVAVYAYLYIVLVLLNGTAHQLGVLLFWCPQNETIAVQVSSWFWHT